MIFKGFFSDEKNFKVMKDCIYLFRDSGVRILWMNIHKQILDCLNKCNIYSEKKACKTLKTSNMSNNNI